VDTDLSYDKPRGGGGDDDDDDDDDDDVSYGTHKYTPWIKFRDS